MYARIFTVHFVNSVWQFSCVEFSCVVIKYQLQPVLILMCVRIQWNPSTLDILIPERAVLIIEMSSSEELKLLNVY